MLCTGEITEFKNGDKKMRVKHNIKCVVFDQWYAHGYTNSAAPCTDTVLSDNHKKYDYQNSVVHKPVLYILCLSYLTRITQVIETSVLP